MVEVYHPSVTLTFETVEHEHRLFLQWLREDMLQVVVDLSAVAHCDSTGLALLLEMKRLCKQKGIQFLLINMSEKVSGLVEFCGVETVL